MKLSKRVYYTLMFFFALVVFLISFGNFLLLGGLFQHLCVVLAPLVLGLPIFFFIISCHSLRMLRRLKLESKRQTMEFGKLRILVTLITLVVLLLLLRHSLVWCGPLPHRSNCSFPAGFYCSDYTAFFDDAGGAIALVLANGMGQNLTVSRLVVSERSSRPKIQCEYEGSQITLGNGEDASFLLDNCSELPIQKTYVGKKYEFDVELTYQLSNESQKRTTTGWLRAHVEPESPTYFQQS